jgi:hypothetical protein
LNILETGLVLAKIKLGDNRQVDEAVIREWHDSLKDLRAEDAIEAVAMHRRESEHYLQPVHVHRGARRLVEARVEASKAVTAADTFTSDPKPDNWEAMCAAHKNPIRFAVEVAKYDQQLLDAGLSPTESRWGRR